MSDTPTPRMDWAWQTTPKAAYLEGCKLERELVEAKAERLRATHRADAAKRKLTRDLNESSRKIADAIVEINKKHQAELSELRKDKERLLTQILNIIRDEPEFPGKMPEELEAFDKETLCKFSCKTTKECILEKVKEFIDAARKGHGDGN